MAVFREALRLVRREANGSYSYNNIPLRPPGLSGMCILAAIDVESATGSSGIAILNGGDWIVEVGGQKYGVILGVEQDTAEILLLGSSTSYKEPLLPPLIHDDGLWADVQRNAVRVTVDGVIKRQYNPEDKTTLALSWEQAYELQAKLTKLLDAQLAPPPAPLIRAVPSKKASRGD